MFGGFGMGELILLFLVVLLLFGAKRLPEIGSSLGKGIREFKSSVSDIEKELKMPDEPRRTQPPPSRPEIDEEDASKRIGGGGQNETGSQADQSEGTGTPE